MLFIYNQFIISLSAAENKLTVLALHQDETNCRFTSEIPDHDLQPGLCYRDYVTYSKQFLDTLICCFNGEVSLD